MLCQVFPIRIAYSWHIPEKKKKKRFPSNFPELLRVPTCLGCSLPAPCRCQPRSLGQCPTSRARVRGSQPAETPQSCQRGCAGNAPTGSYPELKMPGNPLYFTLLQRVVMEHIVHTCSGVSTRSLPGTRPLDKSSTAAAWHDETPEETSAAQATTLLQGSRIPRTSHCCREAAWTKLGCSIQALDGCAHGDGSRGRSSSPGAEPRACRAGNNIGFSSSKAQPGNFCSSVLQVHKHTPLKEFTKNKGTNSNKVLSLPTPSPQGRTSKTLWAALASI